MLEDVTIDEPRDALALLAGHQIDFFTGNSRMLRDRIARAMPAWSPGMPGYHATLAMQAFGFEEMGDYARAEALGRHAIELEPRDGWAQHAVAHVMEMQCRQRDGIAWMRDNTEAWTRDSFFAGPQLVASGAVPLRTRRDRPGAGAVRRADLRRALDARAQHARRLGTAVAAASRGVDVGDRWTALAANWAPKARDGNYAFNDAHAMMAFVGAGLEEPARMLLEAQQQAMAGDGDNAGFTARRRPSRRRCAIKAFGEGNYAEAVRAAAAASAASPTASAAAMRSAT